MYIYRILLLHGTPPLLDVFTFLEKKYQTSRPLQAYFSSGRTYLFLPQESLSIIPGGLHDFHGRFYAWVGAHIWDSQISGIWTRLDHQLHINCLELKALIAVLRHWVSALQGHQVLIATDNTTVVSNINKQGGTHSLTLLRLVVDLFSLVASSSGSLYVASSSGHTSQSQAHTRLSERDSRPPIQAQSADIDRVESPF